MAKKELLCFAIMGVFGSLHGAEAAGEDERLEYQRRQARLALDRTQAAHPMRTGCTNYVYGCGYGAVPGYGSMPGYGNDKNHGR